MTIPAFPVDGILSRPIRCCLIVFLMVLGVPASAFPQVINQKVLKYLASNSGTRIGGGDAADAVTEALRIAGGAFTETDLGSDYPNAGDRMWGTPIKFVSYTNEKITDSNPTTKVQPGDILQYNGAKFVYVTTNGKKSTTTTLTVSRHTSVIVTVNKKGVWPSQVYEQNGPSMAKTDPRKLVMSSIDFNALRAGWVIVYRPKSRIDSTGKYQFSVVNNTTGTKSPTIKSGLKTMLNFSIAPSNLPSSYTALWATSTTADKGFTLVLPNGASMPIDNASSYEIYKKPSGVVSIRKLSP